MGLHRAWPNAEIVGVDIKPQPRYPFKFILGDWTEVGICEHWDFIWASPPCQAYMRVGFRERNQGKDYPALLPQVRDRLMQSNASWVIENVPGAPMRADLILCGSNFGLNVARHRLFEASFPLFSLMPPCSHPLEIVTIAGTGTPSGAQKFRKKHGMPENYTANEKRVAMGIDWMNAYGLSQAIPPAYSEYIAKQYDAGGR